MRKSFYYIAFFVFLTFVQACATVASLTLEDLETDLRTDIFVTTFDGKTIHMLSGQYRVIRTDSTLVLQGSGEYLPSESTRGLHSFAGKLSTNQIMFIESRESTGIGALMFSIPILLLVLIAIS